MNTPILSSHRRAALARARAAFAAGFTLVELLVVVSLIALLIMILIPSLTRAREQARTAACLANLHQIGIAENNYLHEFDNQILAGYVNRNITLSNGYNADAETYVTLLVNGGFLKAPAVPVANASPGALVAAPVAPGVSVLRCPSGSADRISMCFSDNISGLIPNPAPTSRLDPVVSRPWRTRSMSTGLVLDTWYGLNATMADFSNSPAPARRIPDQNGTSRALVKASQLTNPATAVFVIDGIFTHFYYDPDRIAARHNNQTRTNIAFYDGSAATVATARLPGGLGPNTQGSPSAAFTTTNLQRYPETSFMLGR